ncbi:hypothetical protein M434DRAFT_14783 [Hypoxylon sp. CO27-5]|nr:hypothetical protein M434DRAFT_14783 [Hypoxylon sp. CO27-5]
MSVSSPASLSSNSDPPSPTVEAVERMIERQNNLQSNLTRIPLGDITNQAQNAVVRRFECNPNNPPIRYRLGLLPIVPPNDAAVRFQNRRQMASRRQPNLSRDEKIEIRALRKYTDYTLFEIAKKTNHSARQVQWALTGPVTPKKRGHPPPKLDVEMLNKLDEWLRSNSLHRKVAWPDIRWFIPGFESIGEEAINTAMKALGFNRKIRRKTLKLSRRTKRLRKAWAERVLERWPDPQQWIDGCVAFCDETWASRNSQWKEWITIHDMEDPEDWALLRQHGHTGWMFWGLICGVQKGPWYIWPKEYGGVDSDSFRSYVSNEKKVIPSLYLPTTTLQLTGLVVQEPLSKL